MRTEILTFGDVGFEKIKFYCHKTFIFEKDEDIEKVLVFKKVSFGKKEL